MSTENVTPKSGINARGISQADTQSHPSSDILSSAAEGPRASLQEERIQADGNSPARSLRDLATHYHQMGFNVIPLGDDKKPVTVSGSGRLLPWKGWQTTRQTEDSLERFPFERAAGLAAITGEVSGGLACIDFDEQADRSAVDAFLAVLGLPADYPWVVKTHGGYHVWVLCPGLKLAKSDKGKLYRKGVDGGQIELRHERHCTTLPPSLHPDGGQYEFIAGELPSDAPVTVSPEALLAAYDAVTKTEAGPIADSSQVKVARKTARKPGEPEEAYTRAALEGELANVRNATEGHRNDQLNKSAFALGQLVAGGYLDRAEVEAQLTEAALAAGLTEAETRATLRSGLEAGMAEPRTIPEGEHQGYDRRTSGTKSNGRTKGADKGNRTPPPSHDELGDALIEVWDGTVAYFREQWHRYQDGWWKPEPNIASPIWAIMKANKKMGVKPTKTMASSIESYLKSQLYVPDEQVDNGDDYVNLENGLYNLETDTLEPHRRDLYLTSQLGFAYDPEAACPTWLKCLDEWFMTPDGSPDQELINVFQEAFGYSSTADTSYQVAFWLFGEAASGKSTAVKVLKVLMGNAYIEIDLSALNRNQYQLAEIQGKRVVSCTEAAANSVLQDNVFKQLVSGEEVVTRQIRQSTRRFKPQAKVWWAMNEMPRNQDRSSAVYRRLVIIPFRNPVPFEKRDRRLDEKLKAEAPGIFRWALEGLRRLRQQRRFTSPTTVREAVEEYKAENDVEAAFVADWGVCDPKQETKSSTLYGAYAVWCDLFGYKPQPMKTVKRDWIRLGFCWDERRDGNYYLGIGLTAEAVAALHKSGRIA